MNLSVITRNIGVAVVATALFMFASAFVSICYGFDSAFSPLLLSGVITMAAGMFPLIFVRRSTNITMKEGFVIVVFAWILSCFFGMLPYVLWGGEFSLINAWFESVSGFTTTGATILTDVEALPHGLLFWRSSTHFIGGLGVVVFMLLVLPSSSNSYGMRFSKVEMSALSKVNYKFKVGETARIIILVYLGITVVETILLCFAGMSFFDAINHAMSTVATGGFSTKNMSVAAFDSRSVEIIIMIFMYLAGLHFGLIFSSVSGRTFKIFKNPVIKYYTFTVLVAALLITINLLFSGKGHGVFRSFGMALFQTLTASSTTGFATDNASQWPAFSIIILVILSITCACSGSTTGGIKFDRVYIWASALKAEFKKKLHYNAVVSTRIGNRFIDAPLIADVNIFIILYVSIVIIASLLLAAMGVSVRDSLTCSVSSMGNVGFSLFSGGSFGSYDSIPIFGKFILAFEMLLGRLEIYPLLMIFAIKRWK